MKDLALRGALTLLLAGAAACLRQLVGPLCVLAAVMLADYVSGMLSAWANRQLSSRVGVRGLLKKLGCILGVGVALVVDFIVQSAGETLGADLGGVYAFASLVTVWLILNECISILENLAELGVPVPGFLRAVVARLKQRAEAVPLNLPPPLGEVARAKPVTERADADQDLSICFADSSPGGGAGSAEGAAPAADPAPRCHSERAAAPPPRCHSERAAAPPPRCHSERAERVEESCPREIDPSTAALRASAQDDRKEGAAPAADVLASPTGGGAPEGGGEGSAPAAGEEDA